MKRIFLLFLLTLALTGCVSTSRMIVVVRGTQVVEEQPVEFEVQYELR